VLHTFPVVAIGQCRSSESITTKTPTPLPDAQYTQTIFIDDSKTRGYLLGNTTVAADDIHQVEKDLKGLLLPEQSRLHAKAENDGRRRSITRAMLQLPVRPSSLTPIPPSPPSSAPSSEPSSVSSTNLQPS